MHRPDRRKHWKRRKGPDGVGVHYHRDDARDSFIYVRYLEDDSLKSILMAIQANSGWNQLPDAMAARKILECYLEGERLTSILVAIQAGPGWAKLSSTAAVHRALERFCTRWELLTPRRK